MKHHLVLQVVVKLVIPLVLLFALYVQFHGDFGPGGGFQAGVLFASGFILHSLIFGVAATQRVAPPRLVRRLMALGVLVYAGVGFESLLLNRNFLDYSVLADTSVHGQHLGIALVELGVGISVAAVLLMIFYAFADRPSPALPGAGTDHPPTGMSPRGEAPDPPPATPPQADTGPVALPRTGARGGRPPAPASRARGTGAASADGP